jgi:hypothetical protein
MVTKPQLDNPFIAFPKRALGTRVTVKRAELALSHWTITIAEVKNHPQGLKYYFSIIILLVSV